MRGGEVELTCLEVYVIVKTKRTALVFNAGKTFKAISVWSAVLVHLWYFLCTIVWDLRYWNYQIDKYCMKNKAKPVQLIACHWNLGIYPRGDVLRTFRNCKALTDKLIPHWIHVVRCCPLTIKKLSIFVQRWKLYENMFLFRNLKTIILIFVAQDDSVMKMLCQRRWVCPF